MFLPDVNLWLALAFGEARTRKAMAVRPDGRLDNPRPMRRRRLVRYMQTQSSHQGVLGERKQARPR
jgi:hypothetical protein